LGERLGASVTSVFLESSNTTALFVLKQLGEKGRGKKIQIKKLFKLMVSGFGWGFFFAFENLALSVRSPIYDICSCEMSCPSSLQSFF